MVGLSSLLTREIERRGWSMRELAAKSGVSSSTLSNITTKPDVMPDLRTLAALSTALELPMRQLVEACGIPVEAPADDDDERTIALIRAVPELEKFLMLLNQLRPDDRASILAHTESLVRLRTKQE